MAEEKTRTTVEDRPPAEWADAWLKLTGIRTTFREREQLILQFKAAMTYATERERIASGSAS